MPENGLPIYLNDHLGLMTGESELARRVAQENPSTALEEFLQHFAVEVGRQQELLERTLSAIGESPNPLKQAAGWLAEKLGRLKPNDALIGYTDLARVIELETLLTTAQTRLLLWETLSSLGPRAPTSEPGGWSDAAARTRTQLTALRGYHQESIQRAFD